MIKSELLAAIKSFNISDHVKCNEVIQESWLLTEDLEAWAKLEVFKAGDLESIMDYRHGYSDFYKAVNGFRPRWDMSTETLSEWHEIYSSLSRQLDRNRIEEAENERLALLAFKALVSKIAHNGAKDFKTSMRWLMQADGIDQRNPQDVEGFYWAHGILHTNYAQQLIKRKF